MRGNTLKVDLLKVPIKYRRNAYVTYVTEELCLIMHEN